MHRNKLLGLFFFIICLAAAINACAAANTPAGAENASEIASAMAENVSAGASAASENVSVGASAASENASGGAPAASENASAGAPAASENAPVETKMIRIIGTSDLHGKFVPWDYALNQESLSGSLAQLSTAIQEYRTENTLLMDAGDTIQDNSAEIFLSGDDVHPMVQAINALNYDVWVTGNHDYNYGMEITKKSKRQMSCTFYQEFHSLMMVYNWKPIHTTKGGFYGPHFNPDPPGKLEADRPGMQQS